VVEGELGLEPLSQVKATSAASSLALLRFLPSYQYLALCTDPCTVTLLDHAVRPPEGVISSVARDTWLATGLVSRTALTSPIGHDLKDGSCYLVLLTGLCVVVSLEMRRICRAWTEIPYRRVCPAMWGYCYCCGRMKASSRRNIKVNR
jgi:hypothetical protein